MVDTKTTFAEGQLKFLVQRIERLDEEKRALTGDIKEVYMEAKANGFDTKILRQIIKIRKRDRSEMDEEQALIELYLGALGERTYDPGYDSVEIDG